MYQDNREIVAIKTIEDKTGINPIYVKNIDYSLFLKLQTNMKLMNIEENQLILDNYHMYIRNNCEIPLYHLNMIIKDLKNQALQDINDNKNQIGINKQLQNVIELQGMNEIGCKTSPDVQAEMLKEDTRGKVDFKKKVDKLLGLQ